MESQVHITLLVSQNLGILDTGSVGARNNLLVLEEEEQRRRPGILKRQSGPPQFSVAEPCPLPGDCAYCEGSLGHY